MKTLILVLCLVFAFRDLTAQDSVRKFTWQPSPGHSQIPIWPGVPPHAQPVAGPESTITLLKEKSVAGRPWTYISAVTRPTMTVYSPAGRHTRAAVVMFPG